MFEGDSADMCVGKSMGGRAEGLACADPETRTPIGVRGNLFSNHQIFVSLSLPGDAKKSIQKCQFCYYPTITD